MTDVIESFGDNDKQRLVANRVRASVQRGMVTMLNTGYKAGKRLFYPQHNMTITVPEPGSTFVVPEEVAQYLMSMPSRRRLQIVGQGQVPSNFTPPPGYKLVPIEKQDVLEDMNEDTLLVEPEKE